MGQGGRSEETRHSKQERNPAWCGRAAPYALLTLVFSIDLALELLLQSRYLMDRLWFTYLYVYRLTARPEKRFSNRQWIRQSMQIDGAQQDQGETDNHAPIPSRHEKVRTSVVPPNPQRRWFTYIEPSLPGTPMIISGSAC
ncbi:MAG: hypothetical protein KZQ99_10285 [Candidatus Thiodiazotropha sp. (ex Dulcina madagascariensis)]|nr:hypothetical protein [Candidatus Thiodiazotropha sp. (ex Dulcina madagascariensis)]